jgi:hypothetical protein
MDDEGELHVRAPSQRALALLSASRGARFRALGFEGAAMIESAVVAGLASIVEVVRVPAPAPQPQALAHDGEHLWVGSWQTGRLYGLDPAHGTLIEDVAAPGKPVGATVVGDELRVVTSENGDDDHRFVRRFIPGHGFKNADALACPDDTGSFVGWNGSTLWLSQRHNKRLLELRPDGSVARTVNVGEQIVGMTWVGDRVYLSTWRGRERGGCVIAVIAPDARTPLVRMLASVPFVGVGLAHDGQRFWINDFRSDAIVGFTLPRS